MARVVELNQVRINAAVSKAFRNWRTQFKEEFDLKTCLSHLSSKTLNLLVQGHDKSAFYLYDLIMNLQGLGSGFELHELDPKEKMGVMDRYLFLLDRIRFEYMKRLGWLRDYPGEEYSIVDLILRFDEIGPLLQARIPGISREHPSYNKFSEMSAFDKGQFIRKLLARALKELRDHSTTL